MAGRKIRWPEKVSAPDLVLNLYKAIADVQSRPELFMECHVFDGANLKHVPYVYFKEKATPLPKVISDFVGIPFGKKTCATHGCCNPFHFQFFHNPKPLEGEIPPPIQLASSIPIAEYVELVTYYVDKYEVAPTFDNLRGLIPIEDMSDELLNLSIENLKP